MARHTWIRGAVPFIAGGMHVRVTDAAIENLDLHVVLAGIAALKVEWRERRRGALDCVSIGFHESMYPWQPYHLDAKKRMG